MWRDGFFGPTLPALTPQRGTLAFLVRHGVASGLVAEAERIARASGVTPDQAIVKAGFLSEAELYRALAEELGLPYLDGDLPVHRQARFPEAVLTGLVPLVQVPGGPAFAFAPQGVRFDQALARRGRCVPGLAVTRPAALLEGLIAAKADAVAALGADGLARVTPEASFRDGLSPRQCFVVLAAVLGVCCCAIADLSLTWAIVGSILGLFFLAAAALRLAAVLEPCAVGPPGSPARAPDHALPAYSVLVPLFRETRILPRLINAMAALDYPATKLDVMFIVEEEDRDLRAALSDTRLPPFVRVIVVPDGVPRTKPRALNVALPLALGEHTVIYDAEDVPDPGQLRLAASMFERLEPDVACLQARLSIDNTRDSWVTRLFTLDYAALFDVLNPALARFDLPIMLGGTSNHFRTAILRGLGGWDAWNVTEDADLGIRLAVAGYRVADLPSTTLEEAPRELGVWIKQRTRWMKGLVQTSITHSRRPLRLIRSLGMTRFFAAAALSFGTVVSALCYPFGFVLVAYDALAGRLFETESAWDIVLDAIGLTLFAAGLLAITLTPLVGALRRSWLGLLAFVPLMPIYYLMVSWATWRALVELATAPDRWNKTEHGFARTSRAGLNATAGRCDGGPKV